ncbi:MAG: fumarylacetoacetate hydrolase family protein [Candidatus Methylomirabilota bacterium]
MRLVTFDAQGTMRLGAEQHGEIVDLSLAHRRRLLSRQPAAAEAQAERELPSDMLRFLEGWPETLTRAREALAFAEEVRRTGGPGGEGLALPASAVRLAAPILNPRKLICLGLNYRDHAEEAKFEIPTRPVLFSKFATAIIGPGEPILLPSVSREVDYEAELAVVIGRRGRHIPPEQARDHVAGYTILNDVSARDYQLKMPGGQWLAGKSFDTFAPMGPALVTADELPDPRQGLDIRCTVSGDLLQSSNTRQLIFPVPEILAYCSHIFTLEPGDVIATGTPHGVGMARTPPRFLRDGDLVTVEIAGIGALRNPVQEAPR